MNQCFFENDKNPQRCNILTKKNCDNCRVAKTMEQYIQGQQDAENRLGRLGKYQFYRDHYSTGK